MSARERALWYGLVGAMLVGGAACAGFAHGFASQIVAVSLLSVGGGGVLLLVFLEIGLSEDRERAKEEDLRRRRREARRRPRQRFWPRRPS